MSSSSLDIRAEIGVLTSLFKDPSGFVDTAEKITAEDFSEPRYGTIFDAMMQVNESGATITPLTVASTLRNAGLLAQIGGQEEIINLADPTSDLLTMGTAPLFAQVVKEESARRQALLVSQSLNLHAHLDSGKTVEEAISTAQSALTDIATRLMTSEESAAQISSMGESFLDLIEERRANPTGIQGIPTGFIKLDRATSGFSPGQMIVIAARPAVGKSTIAVDIARSVAFNADLSVVVFSLEMSRQEIMERIMSAQSNVPLDSIRSGDLTPGDMRALQFHAERLGNVKITIEDNADMTIEEIRARTLSYAQQGKCDLAIIDYMQLMNSAKKFESRQQEVSMFSRSLKLLAKQAGCPIIAISQLNRGSEQRSDKKPTLSDLRESGAIEQDADIVMLLHRVEDENEGSKTLLLLEKNRQGPTAVIPLHALLEFSKFTNDEGAYPTSDQSIYDEPEPVENTAAPDSSFAGAPPADSPVVGDQHAGGVNYETGEIVGDSGSSWEGLSEPVDTSPSYQPPQSVEPSPGEFTSPSTSTVPTVQSQAPQGQPHDAPTPATPPDESRTTSQPSAPRSSPAPEPAVTEPPPPVFPTTFEPVEYGEEPLGSTW